MPEINFITLRRAEDGTFIVEDSATCDSHRLSWTETIRNGAAAGIYYEKEESRFSDGEGYLPLDLWDSTP